MAEEIKEFLDKFKIGHLHSRFEEQKIDDLHILKFLTDEEINYLTENSIGNKIKLRRAIFSLNETESPSENPAEEDKLTGEPSIKKTCLLENIAGSPPPTDEISFNDENHQNIPIIFVSNDPTEEAHIGNINSPSSRNTASLTTLTYETSSSGFITDGRSTTSKSDNNDMFSPIADFDLECFLKGDILGHALLHKGQKACLSNSDRDKLSELIIKHCINKYGRLSNESLKIVADKIEKTILNEKSSTYYIAPIRKNKSLKNISERSRGKLSDKQRNLLWLINTLNNTEKRTKEERSIKTPDETEGITQEVRDSYIWLKKNLEPASEVLRHWKISYIIRKLEPADTIESFMEKWPVLKSPLAPELINLDFNNLQHQPDNFNLEDLFQTFFELTLETRKKSLSPTDNTLVELLNGEITCDSRVALQLHLLPALVPPKTRIQIGKNNWKPSVSEARDAFFVHVKIPGDVEEAKKKQVDSMFRRGLTVQPYIILIGPSLSNITGSLVIVNNFEFKCLSVLEAIDICFKMYQIFDAKYPFPCAHLWYLLQWRIYKYFTKSDPKIPHINDLI